MQPAYAVRVPLISAKDKIWFMRATDSMTSSKTGIEPPISPVFPACGTTANFYLLQYARMAEIYSFDVGKRAS